LPRDARRVPNLVIYIAIYLWIDCRHRFRRRRRDETNGLSGEALGIPANAVVNTRNEGERAMREVDSRFRSW
jgi:hypothetical protein